MTIIGSIFVENRVFRSDFLAVVTLKINLGFAMVPCAIRLDFPPFCAPTRIFSVILALILLLGRPEN